jgi:protein O-GlcNAc transferase
MKIQLVPDPSPTTRTEEVAARTPYTACPLCEGQEFAELKEVDGTEDAVMGPEVSPHWSWRGCENCGHIFTEGYLQDHVLEQVRRRGAQLPSSGPEFAAKRQAAAATVHRISSMRGCIEGVWLDVGFGGGELLTTASEFGYDVVGIDMRESVVAEAPTLGFEAAVAPLEALEGSELYDVISLSYVLGQTTFPMETLKAAARLLRSGGVVFVATPNLDCRGWQQKESAGENSEWSEVERTQLFSREHLYWAMRRVGLEPCDYMSSANSDSGMEICATLASDG